MTFDAARTASPHPDTQIPFDIAPTPLAVPKLVAPKTPSPGQFRAIAKVLRTAAQGEDDALMIEAAEDVGAWCAYQADLKAARK